MCPSHLRAVTEGTQAQSPVLSSHRREGDNSRLPLGGGPKGEGAAGLFSCVCFGLQLFLPFLNGSSRPRGALRARGAPTAPEDLDLNFGRPPLLTVLKILCPIGAKPSPPPGIRPSAGSPFHRRPGSTWTLLIFLLPFLLGWTQKGQLTCDPARPDPRPPWCLETKALLKK